MRQSIELQEKDAAARGKTETSMDNASLLNRLLNLDLEPGTPEEAGSEDVLLTEEEEDELFNLLQSPTVGKSVTNLSEYLLMTEAMSGRIKVSQSVI